MGEAEGVVISHLYYHLYRSFSKHAYRSAPQHVENIIFQSLLSALERTHRPIHFRDAVQIMPQFMLRDALFAVPSQRFVRVAEAFELCAQGAGLFPESVGARLEWVRGERGCVQLGGMGSKRREGRGGYIGSRGGYQFAGLLFTWRVV